MALVNKIYVLYMPPEETKKQNRKVEESQMVQISIIPLVSVEACWFIQFENDLS